MRQKKRKDPPKCAVAARDASGGLVATSLKSADGEEGAWDTLVRKDGKQVLMIPNARPVSFNPAGDVLLLVEAAPTTIADISSSNPRQTRRSPLSGNAVGSAGAPSPGTSGQMMASRSRLSPVNRLAPQNQKQLRLRTISHQSEAVSRMLRKWISPPSDCKPIGPDNTSRPLA